MNRHGGGGGGSLNQVKRGSPFWLAASTESPMICAHKPVSQKPNPQSNGTRILIGQFQSRIALVQSQPLIQPVIGMIWVVRAGCFIARLKFSTGSTRAT